MSIVDPPTIDTKLFSHFDHAFTNIKFFNRMIGTEECYINELYQVPWTLVNLAWNCSGNGTKPVVKYDFQVYLFIL